MLTSEQPYNLRIFLIDQAEQYIGGAETYFHRYAGLLQSFSISSESFVFKVDDDDCFESLLMLIRKFEPNILHFNKFIHFDRKQIASLRALRIPIILTVHDLYRVPFNISFKNRIKRIVQGKVWYFDHFIIPSLVTFQKLKNFGIKHISYLPQFINVHNWTINQSTTPGNKLLYVGRLEANKGIFLLIDAFKELSLIRSNLSLDIVGEGSCYQKIFTLIKTLNLSDSVRLLGAKDKKQIEEFYAHSSILIFPSINNELFGLVGIESMASQIPVIASDLETIKEWCLNRYTGITFMNNNKIDLQKKIEELLDDDKMYIKLKENAYNYVQSAFSLSSAGQTALDIYNTLLHEKQTEMVNTKNI